MERLIELDGCLNFRDLGGYPSADGRRLRWRRLFRSDALHDLSPADVRFLRDGIGLSEVVDLRSSAERESEGQGLLAEEGIRLHHLPLFDGSGPENPPPTDAINLAERYYLLAEFARPVIGRVVTVLAQTDAPAVYHCAAGKDRTGVVSAVLLGLLGVRDEVIVADYALSQRNLDAIIARLSQMEGYRGMLEQLPPDTLHAEPETMIQLLDRVREKYGSMREYVASAGVATELVERLESELLEEA